MDCQVGVDVSKKSLAIAILAEDGFVLIEDFSNNKSGFQKIMQKIEKLGYTEPVFGCEATGVYHEVFTRTIFDAGFDIAVINPRHIKHETEAQGIKSSTDHADAKVIAYRLSRGIDRFWHPRDMGNVPLRNLTRRREQLKEQVKSEKNRRDRFNDGPCRRSLERSIEFLKKEKAGIEDEMKKLIRSDEETTVDMSLATSIPGVGFIVATSFLGRIGDATRFRSGDAIASFLGVCARQKISGSSVNRSYMSRRGDAVVRRNLYMGALSACRIDSVYQDYYQGMRERGKSHKEAIVAVMRKMIRALYAVLRDRVPFSNERYGLNIK